MLAKSSEPMFLGGATIEWEETGTYEFKTGARAVPNMRPRWLIVTVNNHGKTPAHVEYIATSVCPENELPLPQNLAADYEQAKRLAKMTIAPGTTGLPTKFRSEFSQAAGKIIYGRFYYTDIFGDSHSSGFILKILSSDTMPIEAPPEYTAWD